MVKHDDIDNLLDDFNSEDSTVFTKQRNGKIHSLYLIGYISTPDKYIKWFNILNSATQDDYIVIHINSRGGDLYTTIQLIQAIAQSKASIEISVEGACMSAATFIFFSGDSYRIAEHSVFMFHNYSSFNFGKGGELYDNVVFERKWSKKLLRRTYKDFLSKSEIKDILNNKDIWMNAEEVVYRIEKKMNKQKETVVDVQT